jgi:ABC-type Fe3+/spermidine/putrescine transport system ATPase subunit
MTDSTAGPVLSLRDAALSYGDRVLWRGLDLDVMPGEFLAVLGPNGSGKTSLMRVLLGLQPLTAGTVTINGRPPRRGSADIGYVPQQNGVAPHTPLRARDLVGLGLDGHRWGALLVLALVCTPAAAAMRVTASPALVVVLSVTFALVAVLGGILLALGSSIPISLYVTTISFTLYLLCRVAGELRTRYGWTARPAAAGLPD